MISLNFYNSLHVEVNIFKILITKTSMGQIICILFCINTLSYVSEILVTWYTQAFNSIILIGYKTILHTM